MNKKGSIHTLFHFQKNKFDTMKSNQHMSTQARLMVYSVYALLVLPLSVILVLNKLMSPLSPTLSFGDLEHLV